MKKVVKPLKRLDSPHASSAEDDGRRESYVHPMIAQRAHELYGQRGRVHGHDLEDWFTAERQIQNEARRA